MNALKCNHLTPLGLKGLTANMRVFNDYQKSAFNITFNRFMLLSYNFRIYVDNFALCLAFV